ncbi:hypothetical protein LZ554_000059 [Drepanopeziza brunnea f. sp. 'monogermtubi']|nr:hypothetical protein LZ554_000059 [Drepanopeziza brunnea f. sp. 'monogermtubi']
MQNRNELGFLVPSRYYSSDYPSPPKTTVPAPGQNITQRETMGSSLHSSSEETRMPSPRTGLNLFTIPLEIRLRIYNYVLLDHPLFHAHLAPHPRRWSLDPSWGLKTEKFYMSMVRDSLPSETLEVSICTCTIVTKASRDNASDSPHIESKKFTCTPTSRIPLGNQGKIPTALLLSCRRVYDETRYLPFHTNEFAFISCFWTGIYAARQFTRGLATWQRSQVRRVGVEVLGRDLWIGGLEAASGEESRTGERRQEEVRRKGLGEWRELCALWGEVWIVKLTIKGSLRVNLRQIDPGEPSSSAAPEGATTSASASASASASSRPPLSPYPIFLSPSADAVPANKKCILDVGSDWVLHGLLALDSLRYLELEMGDADVSREEKLVFCADLEALLNTGKKKKGSQTDGGWSGDVRVVLLERSEVSVRGKEGPNGCNFARFGGEPGDEIVWRSY